MNYQNYLEKIQIVNQSDLGASVLILLDLEGILGVRSMRPLSTVVQLAYKEIALVSSRLKNAGYYKIVVCNIHNQGTDLERSILENMGISLLPGINTLLATIKQFSFAVMIGFHGKSNSGGRFDHTFRMDFRYLRYAGHSMGEVGLYARLLMSEGVPVALISGEGNFSDEVDEFDIAIVSSTHNSIQEYTSTLDAVLNQKVFPLYHFPREKVVVQVDNPDKYYILKNFPYYNQQEQCFCFPSIRCFFEHLYDFAYMLNHASELIFKGNMDFILWIEKNHKKDHSLKHLLSDYLSKDVMLLSSYDRIEIAERVGVKYEAFHTNYFKML